MFSNLTVGILAGLGFGAWVFAKMMRRTANNTKSSLVVAVIAGAVVLLLLVGLLQLIPS